METRREFSYSGHDVILGVRQAEDTTGDMPAREVPVAILDGEEMDLPVVVADGREVDWATAVHEPGWEDRLEYAVREYIDEHFPTA